MKIVATIMQGRKSLVPMDAVLHRTCCSHYARRTDESHKSSEIYPSIEAAIEAIGGEVYCCFICLRGMGRHLKW